MSIEGLTTDGNPSDNLSCPQCNTLLPPHTKFCSFCGKQTEASTFLSEELTEPSIPVAGTQATKHDTILFSQCLEQRTTARPLPAVSHRPKQKLASKQPISNLLWPTIIIFSAVAAGLVNIAFTGTVLRPIIAFWFLFVCPGMVLVRFLRLKEPLVEWMVTLALSFSIDAIVAGILLYAGRWSPTGMLSILIGLCLAGAIVQLVTTPIAITPLPKLLPSMPSDKRIVLVPTLLTLLIGMIVATGLWSYQMYAGSHSATPTSPLLHQTITKPSITFARTPVPTPKPSCTPPLTAVSGSYLNVAKPYAGIIFDIPTSIHTRISLTGIQQKQGNICGYFGEMSANALLKGIPANGPFKGTITTAKRIQFIVISDTGQASLSFDGIVQPDGNIAGTYCNRGEVTSPCSDYGLWSVSPRP